MTADKRRKLDMIVLLLAGAALLGVDDTETEEADGDTQEAHCKACGCFDEPCGFQQHAILR
jgi:hypothetical protein